MGRTRLFDFKVSIYFAAFLTIIGSMSAEARLARLNKTEVAKALGLSEGTKPFQMVKRHLIRDLKACQVDPRYVDQMPQVLEENAVEEVKVQGRVAFLSIAPALYRYRISSFEKINFGGKKETGIKISAQIYFENYDKLNELDLALLQDRLDQAAEKWQMFSPYKYPVKFHFTLAKEKSNEVISPHLLVGKYTRGPYFLWWSSIWGYHTISHEMGHVMGLDDEYSNTPFRKMTKCDRNSIMCTSGDPFPYHYYVIFRRGLCDNDLDYNL